MASGLSILLLICFTANYDEVIISCGAGVAFISSIDIIRFNNASFQKNFLKAIDKIVRPSESKTLLGSTYFLLSIFLAMLTTRKRILILSLVNLTFGDPFAALFGIYFRDRRGIMNEKIIDDKNIGGSVVAALICAMVNFVIFVLVLQAPYIGAFWDFCLYFFIALMSEVGFPKRIFTFDDNFTITLYSAFFFSLVEYIIKVWIYSNFFKYIYIWKKKIKNRSTI